MSLSERSLGVGAKLDEIPDDDILSSDVELAGDAEVPHDGLLLTSEMLFDRCVSSARPSLGRCVPVEQTPFGTTLSPTGLMGVDEALVSEVASLHNVYFSRQAFLRDIFLSRDLLLTKGALLMDGVLGNGAALCAQVSGWTVAVVSIARSAGDSALSEVRLTGNGCLRGV